MAHDFIPRRNDLFLSWSANFRARIVASPDTYGLTEAQAAHFAVLQEAYRSAFLLASNPQTRTTSAIVSRNASRAVCEREARRLVRLIQAADTTTNAIRADLGLTIPSEHVSHIPPPAATPRISAKLIQGSTVRLRLVDQQTGRRGKPHGVAGAVIYHHIGNQPPHALSEWKQLCMTSRPRNTVIIRDIAPGEKVWFTAHWYNPRGERGPSATPVSVQVAYQTMLLTDHRHRLAA